MAETTFPYRDPSLSPEERAEDLLGRLPLEDRVGLMFHTVIEVGPDGELLDGPGAISKSSTREVVLGKRMTHFNVHGLPDARTAAVWHNRLQRLAQETEHGVPVTVSTDPRHAAAQNAGTSWAATFFSQWPEPLGLGAIGDVDLVERFGDTVRREYTAVGIRAALHPTADLATEPRWGRQRECFGQDAQMVADMTAAALRGLAGPDADRPDGEPAVAATTKHFPGAGPQKDGEDAHFPYGRDQVYPGGRFAEHLAPFERAIAAGTAAIMPYYGRPVGLVVDGQEIESVGFGFNRQMLTGLLREELGFEGVIVSDWELVNDNHVGDQVLPARAWGVEDLDPAGRMLKILDAGADQFGGEECTEFLLELVRDGRVSEERIDQSARRLLVQKFHLGLFDDPFVDEDAAAERTGRPEDVAEGLRAQARSVVLLHDGGGVLPLAEDHAGPLRVYAEGIGEDQVARLGTVVATPQEADIALVRIAAPFEPRDDLFLEAWFHQGSLEFPPGLAVRLARIREHCPLILDVDLDRAAVLTPLVDVTDALTGTFGVSGRAWIDALIGVVPPEGRLPIELPRSMDAVRASREDVPGDTADPLYPRGHGLDLPARRA
ncbi:glycoside hydrolase family 3 protein [Brachybacterium nesterenkovii]|uniref:glycoside hydrolase family 3 protein n=1 Tax=Brachybacterium nesterenkovii TaxID=47847 RepID=UPI00321B0761